MSPMPFFLPRPVNVEAVSHPVKLWNIRRADDFKLPKCVCVGGGGGGGSLSRINYLFQPGSAARCKF